MKIKTYLDHETILAHQARPVYFALQFQAGNLTQPRPTPAAFCLVIDRSGSMQGEPLARAREATALAVRNLRPEDHFALVAFESAAQTVIPLQPAARKDEFLKALPAIVDGGSTNLTAGWMLGRDALRDAPAGAQRRLLLLSDGHLNQGIVEPAAVRRIVGNGLEQDGIRTSCLGFGSAYNEDLMSELARATNGEFHDAASPEKFPAIFAAELDGLQKLTAQNVRLRLRKLSFCDTLQPLGDYPCVTLPDGRMEYTLGDLVSGEERIACFQLQVLPVPGINGQPVFSLEGEELLAVEVLYDDITAEGVASQTFTQTVRIRATQDPGHVHVNGEMIQWVAVQRAGVATDEVIRHMDAGRVGAALAVLDRALAEVRSWGEGPGVSDALRVLSRLRERIAADGWDARERKSSKYRSKSLRDMSSKPLWTLPNEDAPSFKSSRPRQRPPSAPATTPVIPPSPLQSGPSVPPPAEPQPPEPGTQS